MKQIAVIYHSAQGHTAYVARMIIEGIANVPGTEAQLLEPGALVTAADALFGQHSAETLQRLHCQAQVPAKLEVRQ
ncbi:hypothetical protein [Pseudomonas sp. Q2-TVG4-2]|uniref:hypothetical protein n=1 Tax=Pseudomonas sp. Q2-TVG4-2 TaxID=1685699 RepID=UPI0015E6A656|nr:hypothetical protein [Pseudomonas sp. Q2-TVG4-2]